MGISSGKINFLSFGFKELICVMYKARFFVSFQIKERVSTKLQKLGRLRFLLNFIIKKAANNPEVSNIIAGMLANEIPRKHLANPLFYLRILLK